MAHYYEIIKWTLAHFAFSSGLSAKNTNTSISSNSHDHDSRPNPSCSLSHSTTSLIELRPNLDQNSFSSSSASIDDIDDWTDCSSDYNDDLLPTTNVLASYYYSDFQLLFDTYAITYSHRTHQVFTSFMTSGLFLTCKIDYQLFLSTLPRSTLAFLRKTIRRSTFFL